MLSNGKGFYSTLSYTLECRRLGIGFRSPDVNRSRQGFVPEDGGIRVPLRVVKDLTTATLERYRDERGVRANLPTPMAHEYEKPERHQQAITLVGV